MSPKNALQGHKGAMFLAVQQRWMRSGRPVRNQPNDLTLRYVCVYLDSNRVMRGGSVGKHIARYATQRPLP